MIAAQEDVERLDERKVGPFYFRPLAGKVVVTNDLGRWVQLDEPDFRRFLRGEVAEGTPLHAELRRAGFLREWLDFDELSRGWMKRHEFLKRGTGLHIIVVTLRCNQRCVYCQVTSVPMDRKETDMAPETADKVVDRVFEAPDRELMIEFQGGEPLVNWPVVKRIVERGRRLERRTGKKLTIGLVSNLSLLDEEKLAFLLKRKVTFCTSLDGPAELHEKNRVWTGGSSHGETVRGWRMVYEATRRKRYRIDGLTTVTRLSLQHPREIVDELYGLGARGVYLRFLSPLGYAVRTWDKIGYTAAEFLAFYRQALDRVVELGLKNKRRPFWENTARQFLFKILRNEDPNVCDLRNPCGEGIGQAAYNYDGAIYTSDEGRMMSRMGDESFRIGHVDEGSHAESMRRPAVRALVTSSVLDVHPYYADHAYKPYDGISPVLNYVAQGDPQGRVYANLRQQIHIGILDELFVRLREGCVRALFERWIAKPGQPTVTEA